MADAPPNSQDLIASFVGLTAVSPEVAEEYLANSSWDYESAVTEYYNPTEEADHQDQDQATTPTSSTPQPIPTTSSMPPARSSAPAKKKFATLGDLRGGQPPGHEGHGHDDDDSDDSDENQNLYTGGEKSGLAVENPEDIKKKIIERAKRNARRPGGDDPRAAPSRFTGTARTLGGDDAPSRVIEDPSAPGPQRPEPVERRLHFWEDGFSVDDGPLYRHDDPANAAILAQIKSGRAPISLLNVAPDQEVDVKLDQHEGKYVQPKKKYTPFGGGGQRLGSPTPGLSSVAPPPSVPSPTTTNNSTPAPPAAAAVTLNENEPTISLQIRLGDGTRLLSRFNTTHTVGDVYDFVNASSAASRSRGWVLMTTFPSKELGDKSIVLGEMGEFKRGGVVVQKWS